MLLCCDMFRYTLPASWLFFQYIISCPPQCLGDVLKTWSIIFFSTLQTIVTQFLLAFASGFDVAAERDVWLRPARCRAWTSVTP